MCGITGVYCFNQPITTFLEKVEASAQTLSLRGPDSKGVFHHNRVGLGHARLSIIDVSDAALQPLTDLSKRYTIVYNGEIYNFKTIRKQLEEKGHQFKSSSDTEVILHAYIEKGADCVHDFNGFFAFAIYDNIEESLFIARDRIGIKPLYIYQDKEVFLFGSELKALFSYAIDKDIDTTALHTYLQLNYIPAPKTIFKQVRKLEAGHYLHIQGANLIEKTFYTIPYTRSYPPLAYDKAKDTLHHLLEESVKKRLIADVPVGAFLSGGIDSSVIVALAAKHTPHLNTFSIGYKDEPLFDETQYANLVAKKYNTNHTVFKLTNDDLFAELFHVLDYLDEPFADSSALAVYILSKKTRQHVTVALSGDGADELAAGYNKHWAEYKIRQGGMASLLVKAAHPLWKILPKSRNSFLSNKIRQLDRYAEGLSLSPKERYWRWCAFTDESWAQHMTLAPVNKTDYLAFKNHFTQHIQGADFNDYLYADMHLVLQNDMLVKVDLMSMANSLEVRVPFLDYEIVNFLFTLPSDYKITPLHRKRIIKETFKDILPTELFNRPKHGFEVPLLKWLRNELNDYLFNDLLDREFIEHQQLFNYSEIEKLKTQLMSSNPGESHAQLWGLLVFQYWWKKQLS